MQTPVSISPDCTNYIQEISALNLSDDTEADYLKLMNLKLDELLAEYKSKIETSKGKYLAPLPPAPDRHAAAIEFVATKTIEKLETIKQSEDKIFEQLFSTAKNSNFNDDSEVTSFVDHLKGLCDARGNEMWTELADADHLMMQHSSKHENGDKTRAHHKDPEIKVEHDIFTAMSRWIKSDPKSEVRAIWIMYNNDREHLTEEKHRKLFTITAGHLCTLLIADFQRAHKLFQAEEKSYEGRRGKLGHDDKVAKDVEKSWQLYNSALGAFLKSDKCADEVVSAVQNEVASKPHIAGSFLHALEDVYIQKFQHLTDEAMKTSHLVDFVLHEYNV